MIKMNKLGSFAKEITEVEQFLSCRAAFSDIHHFSKIAFKDFGGHFKIAAQTQFWGLRPNPFLFVR